jgi:hypothetical protein
MSITNFPLKKLIALLLPITFLWLVVGCASICTRDLEEQSADNGSPSIELKYISDCEACPVAFAEKAMVPQRHEFSSHEQTALVILPLAVSLRSLSNHETLNVRRHRQFDPQSRLSLLSALRI